MKNGKETKVVETPVKDIEWEGFDPANFNNVLSLPQTLKDKLTKEGFDWRFLSMAMFRENGNMHRGLWKPYKASPEDGITGINAEGYIQRRDLILGVRPKRVTNQFRQHLDQKNARQAGFNKEQAREMRKLAEKAGISKDTKIYDGYDEND